MIAIEIDTSLCRRGQRCGQGDHAERAGWVHRGCISPDHAAGSTEVFSINLLVFLASALGIELGMF
jgi:hypothetical protein